MKHIILTAAIATLFGNLPTPSTQTAFRPTRRLAGKRYRSGGMSVVIPTGWRTATTQGAVVVTPEQNPSDGGFVVTRHHLSPRQRRGRLDAFLAAELRKSSGNLPTQVALPPQRLRVNGNRAARTIVRATANGRAVEVYAAVVVVDSWAFAFVGLYIQTAAQRYRAVLDTMVATLRGKPPQQNRALLSKLSGCWRHSTFSSSVNGSGSSTTTLRLGRDGTYAYRYYMSVMGAVRRSRARGTWAVYGDQLTTTPGDGREATTYSVRFTGRILYLNGRKYLPCG